MKLNRFFYVAIFCTLIFTSCNKDDDQKAYYVVLGTIERSNGSTYLISDAEDKFLVQNASSINSIDDSARVYVYFTYVEQTIPEGVDNVIEITNINQILLKDIVELTPDLIDSVGNDPLLVNQVWVSRNYLNLDFSIYGLDQNTVHYINLTRAPGAVSTDTVALEIRHNANDDSPVYESNGFVSFNLESLKSDADSVILRVKATEYNGRTFEGFLTYKF